MSRCLRELRAEIPDLAWTETPAPTPLAQQYFAFYGLDVPSCVHRFGGVVAGDYRIALHLFEPPTPTGAVLIVHGYLDHAGVWARMIPPLVEAGLLVAVYDQPGHGLSSGPRADIPDFADYVTVLDAILQVCRENRPMAWNLLAHSMGCAAVVDYLLSATEPNTDGVSTTPGFEDRTHPTPATRPGRVILLAPLCHSAAWKLSGVGQDLARKFVKTVPRTYRDNSSDKEFLSFAQRDPLQVEDLPLHWVTALRQWNERLQTLPGSTRPITILQGDEDNTVDWKYNLRTLKAKLPQARVIMIPGANHQLMNEAPALRSAVVSNVLAGLAD